MATFNALGLKPICGLPNQRQPKKSTQNPTILPPNLSKTSKFSKQNIEGTLVLLATSLSAKFASALTYEEALEQSVSTTTATDFDATSVVEIIVNNPVLIAGGVAVIALPLILSQVLGGKPKAYGVESAKAAYAKLSDDGNAELVDIRSLKDVREFGSPDIRGLKKKTVSIPYRGDDKPGFLQKLSLKFKEPENTTLFVLDKFDGNSELVAELVTANGFKSAFAIKDGAEGPRGWLNSGLPWIQPRKGFAFDFSALTEAFSGSIDEGAGALPVSLGVAAAAGLGVLAFTEIETVLQLLGSAALVQLLSKKLLFAEDRKKTLKQVDEFLTTKVAPKELVSDIKQIGTALLPTTSNNRALPAPSGTAAIATASESAPATDNVSPVTELKTEVSTEPAPATDNVSPVTELTTEVSTEPAPATDNVSPVTELKAEVSAEPAPAEPSSVINSAPSRPRAQSPYPSYPDFKPPTSPCPSQP